LEVIVDFFGSITASLFSALLFAILIWLFRNYIKNYLNSIFYYRKIKKTFGIVGIGTRTDLIHSIFEDLANSVAIHSINFKGYSFIDSHNRIDTTLHQLVNRDQSSIRNVKMLLLNPCSENYIADRMREIERRDISLDPKPNKSDIIRSVQIIKHLSREETNVNFEIKYFDESLKWNLVICDKYIIIGFYSPKVTAIENISLCVRKDSILGYSFEKYFQDIWENRSIHLSQN
jgi:hypothetical protein